MQLPLSKYGHPTSVSVVDHELKEIYQIYNLLVKCGIYCPLIARALCNIMNGRHNNVRSTERRWPVHVSCKNCLLVSSRNGSKSIYRS